MKAAAAKLASYGDAMHEIEELREQIEHLIEGGKLADVHPHTPHTPQTAGHRLLDACRSSAGSGLRMATAQC